jgi:hypothetical protein
LTVVYESDTVSRQLDVDMRGMVSYLRKEGTMPPKPVIITREQKLREYNRLKKQESRIRKRAEGLCIVCGVNKVDEGRTVCAPCNASATARQAARPYKARPSNLVKRQAPPLLRDGYTDEEVARAFGLPLEYVQGLIETFKLRENPPPPRKLTAAQKSLRKRARSVLTVKLYDGKV